MPSAPLVVFLHIPKTAGTAIIETLQAKLSEETFRRVIDPLTMEATPPGWEQHRLVAGHMEMNHAAQLPGDKIYAAVLRDPGERAMSFLNHVQKADEHPLKAELAGLSLLDALERSYRFRTGVCNRQCGILSGAGPSYGAAVDMLLRERWIIGTDPQQVFDRMCKALGLAAERLPRLNVGRSRPQLSARERKILDAENQEDHRLLSLFP